MFCHWFLYLLCLSSYKKYSQKQIKSQTFDLENEGQAQEQKNWTHAIPLQMFDFV